MTQNDVVLSEDLATLGLNLFSLRKKGRDLSWLAAGFIAATFLVGILGTSVGLYQAGSVIETATPWPVRRSRQSRIQPAVVSAVRP